MVLSCSTALAQDWKVVRNVDPLSGGDRSYIATTAVRASYGYDYTQGTLAFACLRDGLNVLYRFDSFMAGDADLEVFVTIGFDDKKPLNQYWELNTERKGAFIRIDRVSWFVNEAKSGRLLNICAEDPFDNETICHTFSLMGASAALNSLSCYLWR